MEFIRRVLKTTFAPENMVSNIVWGLVWVAVPTVASVLAGFALKLSLGQQIALGIALFLLLVAGGLALRERHRRREAPPPPPPASPPARPLRIGYDLTGSGHSVIGSSVKGGDIGIRIGGEGSSAIGDSVEFPDDPQGPPQEPPVPPKGS